MTTRSTSTPGATSRGSEATLLARLGLPASASPQDVEVAHEELVGFLETAPIGLRPWAAREIDRVDEAYALLSDPTQDRTVAATTAIAGATVKAATMDSAPVELDDDSLDDFAEDAPVSRHDRRETERRQRATARRQKAGQGAANGSNRFVRRLAIIAIGIVGVVAIAIAGFNMGGGTRLPGVTGTPDPAAIASPAIDTARVAELMQRISADPRDVESLQSLADIYYIANDFETAGGFLETILTVDPEDLTARLALGAALFNLGKPDEAEAHWRQVLTVDPDNLEALYDLGFMYLSRTPADVESARREWTRVIEIAPDSDVAKSIEQHLASLDASPAPGASAPATSSPGSSAPSPVASPTASGD